MTGDDERQHDLDTALWDAEQAFGDAYNAPSMGREHLETGLAALDEGLRSSRVDRDVRALLEPKVQAMREALASGAPDLADKARCGDGLGPARSWSFGRREDGTFGPRNEVPLGKAWDRMVGEFQSALRKVLAR